MSLAPKILRIVMTVIGYMVVADVVGVILGFIIDILPIRGHDGPVGWAIWLAMGVFAGILSYNSAGEAITQGEESDWTARPNGRSAGFQILVVTGMVVLGVYGLCNVLLWKKGIPGEAFVPDSPTFTVLFLASVFLSTLGVFLFIPPSKSTPPKAPPPEA